MEIEDFLEDMTAHTESYEHLGEVRVWVQDMHPVWEAKRSAARVTFPTEDVYWRDEVEISMSREQVWDYLIQPEFRNTLIGTDRMEIANRANGRIAPGSVNQCYHGDKMVPQTILEWQPFESMIVKELFPKNHAVSWLAEYRLHATEGGTRPVRNATKPAGPVLGRTLLRLLSPLFRQVNKRLFAAFAQHIEIDFQARGGMLKGGAEVEVTEEQIRQAAQVSLQAPSGSRQARE